MIDHKSFKSTIENEIRNGLKEAYSDAKVAEKELPLLESEVEELQKQLNELRQENGNKHAEIDNMAKMIEWSINKHSIVSSLTDEFERENSSISSNNYVNKLDRSVTDNILAKVEEIFDLASIENSPLNNEELDEEIRHLEELNQNAANEIEILENIKGNDWNSDNSSLSTSFESFCDKNGSSFDSNSEMPVIELTEESIAKEQPDLFLEKEEMHFEERTKNDIQELEKIIVNFTESQKKATVNAENVFMSQSECANSLREKMNENRVSEEDFYKYEQMFLERIKEMGSVEEFTPITQPLSVEETNQNMIKNIVDDFKHFLIKNSPNLHFNSEEGINEVCHNIEESIPKELPTIRVFKKSEISPDIAKISLSLKKLNKEARENLPIQEQEDIHKMYDELNDMKMPDIIEQQITEIPEIVEPEDIDVDLSFINDFKSKAEEFLPESYSALFENPVIEDKFPEFKEKHQAKNTVRETTFKENNPVEDINAQANALLQAIEQISLDPLPTLDISSIPPLPTIPKSDADPDTVIESFNEMFDADRYKAKIAYEDAKRFEEKAKELEPKDNELKSDTTVNELAAAEEEVSQLEESIKNINEENKNSIEELTTLEKSLSEESRAKEELSEKIQKLKINLPDVESLRSELEKLKENANNEIEGLNSQITLLKFKSAKK